MLSTVQIISGDDNKVWARDELDCVLEIRSEHKLDDPTSFAIMMRDMLNKDGTHNDRKLKKKEKVAVLVRAKEGADWTVLFQGRVKEIDAHQTQGGVGSTAVFRGEDVRMELASYANTGGWTGHIDEIMKYLIGQNFTEMAVDEPPNNEIDDADNALGQNGNNLEFLRTQAVERGFNFWMSYDLKIETSIDPRSPTAYNITPKVHWARSPYSASVQPSSTAGIAGAVASAVASAVGLGGDDIIQFDVQAGPNSGGKCPNVTSFETVNIGLTVLEMAAAQVSPTPGVPGTNGLPPSLGATESVPLEVVDMVYFVPPTVRQTADAQETATNRAEVRAFDTKVKISARKSAIERIILPQDLADLLGVNDNIKNFRFRVAQVLHVIRIDEHFMDVILESDGNVPSAGATTAGLPSLLEVEVA